MSITVSTLLPPGRARTATHLSLAVACGALSVALASSGAEARADSPWALPDPAPGGEGPDAGGAAGTADCGAPWRNLRDTRLWNILLDVHRVPGTDHVWAVGSADFGPNGITAEGGDPLVIRTASWNTGWEVIPMDLHSEALPGAEIRLQTVHFADPTRGWAAGMASRFHDPAPGANGTTAVIYRTDDGGATWSLVFEGAISPAFPDHIIVDMEFTDRLRGWAAGAIDRFQGIAIVHTEDGGDTWTPQVSGVDAAVGEVDFLDGDTGFAVANLGYTLRTTDGGETWRVVSQSPSLGEGALGLDFLDESTGFATNVAALILRTIDGGVTWEPAHSVHQTLWDVAFADSRNGWAAGDYGLCAFTRDGGETWETSLHGAVGGDLRACVPVDGDTVLVAGDWGTIAYTIDAGVSWRGVDGKDYITPAHITALDFIDERTGWIVGLGGEVVHTRDGGATWEHRGEGFWARFSDVDFVDALRGWAISGPEVWHTGDGGWSWVMQQVLPEEGGGISFIDPERGWISSHGVVFRTTDGGLEWEPRDARTGGFLYDVRVLPGGVGWAVGERGAIVRTADGGETWEPQESGVTTSILYSVSAVDESTAWVAGLGFLLHTEDGLHWHHAYGGPKVRSVHFVDRLHGCAAGGFVESGSIACTDDGGLTWRECLVPDERDGRLRLGRNLHGVFLASPDVAYALGERGAVLKLDRRVGRAPAFLRGDSNGDGAVEISDAITSLNALFLGAMAPGCDDASDSNDDGLADISDPINTLGVLFLGRGSIPLPGMDECGLDPTEDDLGCEMPGECP